MNTILEFVQGAWAEALGFAVLHSLWQGLIIFMLVVGILRCVPSRFSGLRYGVAGAGMVLIFITAVATFLMLYNPMPTDRMDISTEMAQTGSNAFNGIAQGSFADWLTTVSTFLHSIVPFVVLAWVAGSILFLLRLFGGWWFTGRLKQTALPLTNDWSVRIAELAKQFELKRAVRLAESTFIHAPVVIGFLKPIILIPTGMCTGLSTAQLESIFIHELIHIRRNDYLLNLLQSIVEALFFFNPFAWMISGILRQEREHCCDDAVVLHQGNALAYAHALATLEEVRLTRAGLALSLAENKNQLLNRIKRIMEKSVKNYSLRERMAPVVLLVIGLTCASWLTVHTSRTEKDLTLDHTAVASVTMAADTSKKKKARHEGLKKITPTAPVAPEALEEIENEQEIDAVEEIEIPHMDIDVETNLEDMDFDIQIPPMPPMPNMEPMEPLELFYAPMAPMNMQWNDNQDWGAFNEAFEQKFKEQFGDFYSKNEEKMKAMMDELEKNMKENWDHEAFAGKMEAFAARQAEFASRQGERMAAHAEGQYEKQAALAERQAERSKAHAERQADAFRMQSEKHAELAKRHEEMAQKHRDTMHNMKKDLKAELIKDGYLGKDENINSIDWSHPGDLKVNGKTVKESDKKKYEAIHQKYFNNGGTFHYSEN